MTKPTCRPRLRFPHRNGSRGASSMLVIAVLVLLGSLTVYVTGLVSSVNNGYAMEFNLARASQAAEAGLEWGRYRMLINNAPCPPFPTTQNVTMPGSLSPYTVTLRCTPGTTESPATLYRLTATACNLPLGNTCPNTSVTPRPDYVEREVTALVER